MNRRSFLQAVAATLVAPSLPLAKQYTGVEAAMHILFYAQRNKPLIWRNYAATYTPKDAEFLNVVRKASQWPKRKN